jgi:hypothetical protein
VSATRIPPPVVGCWKGRIVAISSLDERRARA